MLFNLADFEGDVFERLIAEHREIARMLDELDGLPAHARTERTAAFDAVARALRIHDQAEDDVVFPPLDHSYELGAHMRVDHRDHAAIEAQLRAIEEADRAGADWARKLAALVELVRRHFADEEEFVIPHARNVISGPRAAELLSAFLKDREYLATGKR
jgi:hemerythrin-like domain-containing protein